MKYKNKDKWGAIIDVGDLIYDNGYGIIFCIGNDEIGDFVLVHNDKRMYKNHAASVELICKSCKLIKLLCYEVQSK